MAMSDTNIVILMGRLTRDPKYTETEDGKEFCNFTIASNDRGSAKEKVCFQDAVTIGSTARLMRDYGKKSKKVQVVGKLFTRQRRLQDNSYEEYNIIEVDDLKFLDGKYDDREDQNGI